MRYLRWVLVDKIFKGDLCFMKLLCYFLGQFLDVFRLTYGKTPFDRSGVSGGRRRPTPSTAVGAGSRAPRLVQRRELGAAPHAVGAGGGAHD